MKPALILILSLVLTSGIGFFIWARANDLEHDGFAWVYRSKYYSVRGDGCQLLDEKLGSRAHTPLELVVLMSWPEGLNRYTNQYPYDLEPKIFSDLQHQALVRLLSIQEKVFQVEVPAQHEFTLMRDHTGILRLPAENGNGDLHFQGSASVYPDEFQQHPWEGYFRWELFRFEPSGKLVGREALRRY